MEGFLCYGVAYMDGFEHMMISFTRCIAQIELSGLCIFKTCNPLVYRLKYAVAPKPSILVSYECMCIPSKSEYRESQIGHVDPNRSPSAFEFPIGMPMNSM